MPWAGVEAQPLGSTAHAQVCRQEGIRIAERSHGHVRGSPSTNAGQGEELCLDLLPVGATVKYDVATRDGRGQSAQGFRASACDAEHAQILFGPSPQGEERDE